MEKLLIFLLFLFLLKFVRNLFQFRQQRKKKKFNRKKWKKKTVEFWRKFHLKVWTGLENSSRSSLAGHWRGEWIFREVDTHFSGKLTVWFQIYPEKYLKGVSLLLLLLVAVVLGIEWQFSRFYGTFSIYHFPFSSHFIIDMWQLKFNNIFQKTQKCLRKMLKKKCESYGKKLWKNKN